MHSTGQGPRYPHLTARIDVDALKQAHPVEDVLTRYGIELRRQGRAAVGRCPFHTDRGRPNLYVWPQTASWYCFRCCVGGDVVRFVELSQGLGFRDAVEVLAGSPAAVSRFAHPFAPHPAPPARPTRSPSLERDSDELAALRAATSLYHRRLLTDSEALEYVEQRGLDRAAIDTCQIGYAAGDELVPFLRWRRIELGPALRVGLLDRCGQEFLAGRIVVTRIARWATGMARRSPTR